MTEVEIEIDGQKLKASPDQTVIQVADDAGIYIPRFCYHKELSIPANCRMCLVEMEKSAKPVPACATPVSAGMKIFTRTEKAVLAQRAVMEFLLINHPLDCPICDQGGECELQDLSMGYGASSSKYNECKRSVADENLGPLIATEMTRCILCTRCIRFGDEIAGMRELGMTFRGELEEVTTFVQHAMRSEVSGNIIDLCPVGALTSKPFRFRARAWELDQYPSVSPHDCLGSNIHVHTRYGKVMRVVSRENAAINQTWLSDRDRFSYTGLYHPDRLAAPRIKVNGRWENVDWEKALQFATKQLQSVIKQQGADQFAALASPNSTLEEFYLLQKLVRALGSPHVDHRLRECDTSDQTRMPSSPGLNLSLADVEKCDAIILVGSNLQKEQPLMAVRMRRAKANTVVVINSVDYDFNFPVHTKKIVSPAHIMAALRELLDNFETSPLKNKQKVLVLLGAQALHHPQAAEIRNLAHKLAKRCQAEVGFMTDGANTAGGWIAGAIPHRDITGMAVPNPGLSAYELMKSPRKALLLMNVEPEFDCANAQLATKALQEAECVIALSQYQNPLLESVASVILPLSAFTESAGTYVNVTGEWQSVQGVAKAFGQSRPGWKILRVLGNFMQLSGFDYESAEAIRHEIHKCLKDVKKFTYLDADLEESKPSTGLTRIGEIPLYAIDGLTRRAQPLQAAQAIIEGEVAVAKLHSRTAHEYGLNNGDTVLVTQGEQTVELPVQVDNRIAEQAVWIAGGIAATQGLGDLFGEMKLEKR